MINWALFGWWRSWISTVLLVSLATFAQVAPLHKPDEPPMAPITLVKDKDTPYPIDRAEKIYFEACAAVALALNPSHPADIRPPIQLELGAKDEFADVDARHKPAAHIAMKEWNDEKFAFGVATVARDAALSNEDLIKITRHVTAIVNATVNVNAAAHGH